MTIPKYVLENTGCKRQRDFKALKRAQLRNLKTALDAVRCGCAYAPLFAHDGPITQIESLIEELQSEWSAKKWGR